MLLWMCLQTHSDLILSLTLPPTSARRTSARRQQIYKLNLRECFIAD